MARKIKIPNERLKRFAREEQKRKKNIRNKRKYYLIVCEGEATEPNYFEGLKQDLPKGVLTAYHIDIAGTGRNTQSLVDEALRLKGAYEKVPPDRLINAGWCLIRTVFRLKILIPLSNVAEILILDVPGAMRLLNFGICYIFNITKTPCPEGILRG